MKVHGQNDHTYECSWSKWPYIWMFVIEMTIHVIFVIRNHLIKNMNVHDFTKNLKVIFGVNQFLSPIFPILRYEWWSFLISLKITFKILLISIFTFPITIQIRILYSKQMALLIQQSFVLLLNLIGKPTYF